MREVLLLERRARLQGAGSQCHAHSCRFCASLSVRWPGSSHTLPSSSIGGPPGHGVDGRLNVVPATSICRPCRRTAHSRQARRAPRSATARDMEGQLIWDQIRRRSLEESSLPS